MSSPEEFDRRLAARLDRMADQSLGAFNAHRVAEAAMERRPKTWWPLVLTAAAAVLFVGAAASVGSSLFDRDLAPAASVSPESASVLPAPSNGDDSASPSSSGLAQEAAIAAARAAAPQSADEPVLSAQAGPFDQVLQPPEAYEFASELPRDRWVWVIVLGSGNGLDGQGTIVVIDFLDGRVYGVMDFRS